MPNDDQPNDQPIQMLMEQASVALAQTDYPTCERYCLEALSRVQASNDFDQYARILMPLQEARRQRRQAALDAGVVVLTEYHAPEQLLDQHAAGALLLIAPAYDETARQAIHDLALARGQMIEVLLLSQDQLAQCFEQQMEQAGDAILAQIPTGQGPEQFAMLAKALPQIGDHEIAHQRLAAIARHLNYQKAPS